MRFGTLYQKPKSKEKFVNQLYPTKISKIRAFLVFMKTNFWKIQIFRYNFLILSSKLYKFSCGVFQPNKNNKSYSILNLKIINNKNLFFSQTIGLATKLFPFFHDFQSKLINTNNKHY